MIDSFITLLLVVVFSILVGRAVMLACGRREWIGIEPALGYATMVTVGGLLAELPGRATTLKVAIVVLALVGLYAVFQLRSSTLPRARGFWIASAITLAMVAIPFLVTGFWGLLGMGYNNDLGLHLAWAQWLSGDFGTVPDTGYPLGPHSLVAGLTGLGLVDLGPAFIGQVMALPVLLTMTGYAAVSSLAGWRRVLASVLIGLPYLIASFYAQAAFKEVTVALLLLAIIVLLPETKPLPSSWKQRFLLFVPFTLLTLGAIFTFSFPAIAFLGAVVAVWLISDADFRRHLRPRELLRLAAWPVRNHPVITAVAVVALIVVGALTFWTWLGFAGYFLKVSRGSAFGPVSPFEALGVWLTPDYRLESEINTPFPLLMMAIGAAALAAAIFWWIRRPRSPYPLALIGLFGFYLFSAPWAGDYSLAKALTIMSPVVMIVVLSALLDRPFPKGGAKALAWGGLATVFITLALASSLLVLRDASIGPSDRYDELAGIAAKTAGRPVLLADQDRFGPYYLPDSKVGVPLTEFPDRTIIANRNKPFKSPLGESAIDFDSFDPLTFRNYPFVLTTSAAWASLPPEYYKEVARSPSWILWKKRGPIELRPIMKETRMAARQTDCVNPDDLYYSKIEGTATLKPETIIVQQIEWSPSAQLKIGQTASLTTTLGKGKWRISLQYSSPVGATLTAPGFRQDLIASLNGQRRANRPVTSFSQFWPAGVIDVKKSGPVEFQFQVDEPSLIQRVTGYGRRTSLGRLALTRDEPHRKVPMSEICGEWVDFYEPEEKPGNGSGQ